MKLYGVRALAAKCMGRGRGSAAFSHKQHVARMLETLGFAELSAWSRLDFPCSTLAPCLLCVLLCACPAFVLRLLALLCACFVLC